ncbi:hypothetical protein cand_000020 [Cryptosporidium andersoni]|uniref:Uncharacterized protein n=1 Tax=Cryptosporidium andersoni TaxID=117008 RepID=A0A1J4MQT5_9CRYT|nr:hypothetical protein cand_000020 [Cryptosporidium andersoni]
MNETEALNNKKLLPHNSLGYTFIPMKEKNGNSNFESGTILHTDSFKNNSKNPLDVPMSNAGSVQLNNSVSIEYPLQSNISSSPVVPSSSSPENFLLKTTSNSNIPEDLRHQFELALKKARSYIEKEYIDRMRQVDAENAIKLQKELNKILQAEREALDKEKRVYEQRLREQLEEEMKATIERATVEYKRKTDVSLAEMRKDMENQYKSRQKDIDEELCRRKLTLEKEYKERIELIENQYEEKVQSRIEIEKAKYSSQQQSQYIDKEKEYLESKLTLSNLQEQLSLYKRQKDELESMSSATISSLQNYLKELKSNQDVYKDQISIMEKTIFALNKKENETLDMVEKVNNKMKTMIEFKEAKKIAYSALLKGRAVQMLDEFTKRYFKVKYLKYGFDTFRKLLSSDLHSCESNKKASQDSSKLLYTLRKEQLMLLAENERLTELVDNLKKEHINELKKTQEAFMMYRRNLDQSTNKSQSVVEYELRMTFFAYIVSCKRKFIIAFAFRDLLVYTVQSTSKMNHKELSVKNNVINRMHEINNKTTIDIHIKRDILSILLHSVYNHIKLRMLSYSWRHMALRSKSPMLQVPPVVKTDYTNNTGPIDSLYMRDFINSMGNNSVINFAHQPSYYAKLPSVNNIQSRAVFVPLRRDNPISFGSYFQYSNQLSNDFCVVGKPLGSLTNQSLSNNQKTEYKK